MTWTKQEIIEQAFDEIGYSPYVYDLSANQLDSALRKLDTMVARWNSRGILLGYPLPTGHTDSALTDNTDMPDMALEACILNLAIRVAPSVGKMVSSETRSGALRAYKDLLAQYTKPYEMQLPHTMPAGAGNRRYRENDRYLNRPTEHIVVKGDDKLDL